MAVFTHLDFKRNVDTAPSAFVKISFLSVSLLQLFGRSVDMDQGHQTSLTDAAPTGA
jgi:hypothetical protein